jgi:hypothetical protein
MEYVRRLRLEQAAQKFRFSDKPVIDVALDAGYDWPADAKQIWTLIIRIPDLVGAKDLKDAVQKLRAKGKDPEVAEVAIEKLNESRCVQVLHVGSYDRVGEAIEILRNFAAEQGLAFRGAHHEIYFPDPRRVAPKKRRTIVRHPVS